MMRIAALVLLLSPGILLAQTDSAAQRVADDARALRRIADASRRDFPSTVASRIVEEDLDLLRGRRSDGTYEYAQYERQEAARIADRHGVRSSNESEPEEIELAAETVYQMIISVPNRRLLVARNRRVWIERVDMDITPFGGVRQSTTTDVRKWIGVGESATVDFPEIAKRVRARVIARVDEADGGPATVEVVMLQARLVDKSDSPYFSAVQALTALARAVDKGDASAVKTHSSEVLSRLGTTERRVASVIAPAPSVAAPPQSRREPEALEETPLVELYVELQTIEDLLTGSESERRDGLDKLHQLVRRLRPSSAAER